VIRGGEVHQDSSGTCHIKAFSHALPRLGLYRDVATRTVPMQSGSRPVRLANLRRALDSAPLLSRQASTAINTLSAGRTTTPSKNSLDRAVALVVEDDELVRMRAVALLDAAGLAVTEACDVDEA
jgi:hypothetical protein